MFDVANIHGTHFLQQRLADMGLRTAESFPRALVLTAATERRRACLVYGFRLTGHPVET
jgi:hypothetical protein